MSAVSAKVEATFEKGKGVGRMALSDLEIRERMEKGEIFIHPYEPLDVGSASVDVRLGSAYFEASKPKYYGGFYNIYSQADTDKVWGNFKTGVLAVEYKRRYQHADWSNIADDDLVILLWPRANLLCHTMEFIGAKVNATTMMKARSTIGRSLVNVCQCAGMGDIGYFNRWTMEIYNRGEWTIPLVVGRRVAQIVFLDTGPSEKSYISKYQGTDDVEELVKSWSPDDMKPRAYLDRDINRRYIEVTY